MIDDEWRPAKLNLIWDGGDGAGDGGGDGGAGQPADGGPSDGGPSDGQGGGGGGWADGGTIGGSNASGDGNFGSGQGDGSFASDGQGGGDGGGATTGGGSWGSDGGGVSYGQAGVGSGGFGTGSFDGQDGGGYTGDGGSYASPGGGGWGTGAGIGDFGYGFGDFGSGYGGYASEPGFAFGGNAPAPSGWGDGTSSWGGGTGVFGGANADFGTGYAGGPFSGGFNTAPAYGNYGWTDSVGLGPGYYGGGQPTGFAGGMPSTFGLSGMNMAPTSGVPYGQAGFGPFGFGPYGGLQGSPFNTAWSGTWPGNLSQGTLGTGPFGGFGPGGGGWNANAGPGNQSFGFDTQGTPVANAQQGQYGTGLGYQTDTSGLPAGQPAGFFSSLGNALSAAFSPDNTMTLANPNAPVAAPQSQQPMDVIAVPDNFNPNQNINTPTVDLGKYGEVTATAPEGKGGGGVGSDYAASGGRGAEGAPQGGQQGGPQGGGQQGEGAPQGGQQQANAPGGGYTGAGTGQGAGTAAFGAPGTAAIAPGGTYGPAGAPENPVEVMPAWMATVASGAMPAQSTFISSNAANQRAGVIDAAMGDATLQQQLFSMVYGETGSQGPTAQAMVMQTMIDRAAALSQKTGMAPADALKATLNNAGYYAKGKTARAARSKAGQTFGRDPTGELTNMLAAIGEGMSTAGLATGNASANVGFGWGKGAKAEAEFRRATGLQSLPGKPVGTVATAGGENFGVEKGAIQGVGVAGAKGGKATTSSPGYVGTIAGAQFGKPGAVPSPAGPVAPPDIPAGGTGGEATAFQPPGTFGTSPAPSGIPGLTAPGASPVGPSGLPTGPMPGSLNFGPGALGPRSEAPGLLDSILGGLAGLNFGIGSAAAAGVAPPSDIPGPVVGKADPAMVARNMTAAQARGFQKGITSPMVQGFVNSLTSAQVNAIAAKTGYPAALIAQMAPSYPGKAMEAILQMSPTEMQNFAQMLSPSQLAMFSAALQAAAGAPTQAAQGPMQGPQNALEASQQAAPSQGAPSAWNAAALGLPTAPGIAAMPMTGIAPAPIAPPGWPTTTQDPAEIAYAPWGANPLAPATAFTPNVDTFDARFGDWGPLVENAPGGKGDFGGRDTFAGRFGEWGPQDTFASRFGEWGPTTAQPDVTPQTQEPGLAPSAPSTPTHGGVHSANPTIDISRGDAQNIDTRGQPASPEQAAEILKFWEWLTRMQPNMDWLKDRPLSSNVEDRRWEPPYGSLTPYPHPWWENVNNRYQPQKSGR